MLALVYEDLNDNQQLRHDPVLAVLAGKAEPDQQALAGKSTLNRRELGNGTPNRYDRLRHSWRATRTFLSRLLRSLLLSAVIRVCWRACAVRPLAAEKCRLLGRKPQRDPACCGKDSRSLAGSKDRTARRFGLLPGRNGWPGVKPITWIMCSAWHAILCSRRSWLVSGTSTSAMGTASKILPGVRTVRR